MTDLPMFLILWATLWSVLGPISFFFWCSWAYGWFEAKPGVPART